jgi:hypothetical protein
MIKCIFSKYDVCKLSYNWGIECKGLYKNKLNCPLWNKLKNS